MSAVASPSSPHRVLSRIRVGSVVRIINTAYYAPCRFRVLRIRHRKWCTVREVGKRRNTGLFYMQVLIDYLWPVTPAPMHVRLARKR